MSSHLCMCDFVCLRVVIALFPVCGRGLMGFVHLVCLGCCSRVFSERQMQPKKSVYRECGLPPAFYWKMGVRVYGGK